MPSPSHPEPDAVRAEFRDLVRGALLLDLEVLPAGRIAKIEEPIITAMMPASPSCRPASPVRTRWTSSSALGWRIGVK